MAKTLMEQAELDSGWQTIPFKTGYTGNSSIRYRKIGNTVSIIYAGTISGLTANTDNIVASVPNDCKPSYNMYTDYKGQVVTISSGGNVDINPTAASIFMGLTLTYFIG